MNYPNPTIIKYGRCEYRNLGDFHTHTVFSLHGMSSPSEIVDRASDIGLKYLAITDHHTPYGLITGSEPRYEDPIFYAIKNQEARMWEYKRSFPENIIGVNVIPGYEYNLFVPEDRCVIKYPHLRIIGAHSWHFYGSETTVQEMEEEIHDKLKTGRYSFLVHPERGIENLGKDLTRVNPSEWEEDKNILMRGIPHICKELDIPIELNVSSLKNSNNHYKELIRIWLEVAMNLHMHVIVNSDAHVKYDIAMCHEGFNFLFDMGFPASRIINFDDDLINHYLSYTSM